MQRPPPHRWLALFALIAILPAAAALAAEPAPVQAGKSLPAESEQTSSAALLDRANLLLFAVSLDQLSLTDGLSAYGDPADPLIPIGELTRLLEMDVDVMPTESRVIGRLGEERRSLIIDVGNHLARDGARSIPLADGDVVVGPADIYIKASVLQKVFPLKLKVDPEALDIKITATEPVPVQQRLQRLARTREEANGGEPQDLLLVPNPYGFLTPPGADVTLSAGLQGQTPHAPFSYDVHAGADFLGTNFQGYLGSDQHGAPTNARVLFERRSITGNLLGPLHARVVGVGDVFSPGLPLGVRSINGRGIAFSTAPLDTSNVFNRIDLRGELPSGYDAELYVNDVLRGGQNTPVKGRYEFLNVPLSPGINVIRIVMYGPRGERQEETSIINVGAGLLKQGQSTFDFAALQQNDEVFRLGPSLDPSAAALNVTARGVRVVGALNYGLRSWLTASLGAATYPTLKGPQAELVNLGARTSIMGLAVQGDVAGTSTSGVAADLGLAGQFRGVSAVLRQTEYRNGFTEENATGADTSRLLADRTELTVDDNINLRGRIIPISVRGLRDHYRDGSYDLTGSARASSSVAGILLSSELSYTRTAYRGAAPVDRLTGYLAASTFKSYRWQIRATLDYELIPDFQATAASLVVDRTVNQAWALRFGVGAPLNDLSGYNLTASSIFKSRYGDLTLTGGYSNQNQSWNIGAQLSFGLAFDPLARRYAVTRAGPGSGGTAVFQAFLDENGDGVYEPGEPPVSKVHIEGGDGKRTTDARGRALITGMGAGPNARLTVGLDDIDDNSVKSPSPTIQVATRPGAVSVIPYPMQPVSEVVIKVQLRRPDGQKVGLSATRMRLVEVKTGKVVEGSTEFDGSLILDDVRPGTYRAELDPKQAEQLRMHLVNPISVTVYPDGRPVPDSLAEVVFDPRAEEKKEDSAPAPK